MSTGLIIIIIAAFIVLILIRNHRVVKNEERGKRTDVWGQANEREISADRMDNIAGLHRYLSAHDDRFSIDSITWNDLNLDDIYAATDTCSSSVGEEYLYHILRTPEENDEQLSARASRIRYFRNNRDQAVSDLILFAELGKCRGCSFAETVLNVFEAGHISIAACIIQPVLLILAVLMIVFRIRFGIPAVVIMLIINLSTYFKKKGVVGDQIISVNYLVSLIRLSKRALKSDDDEVLEPLKKEISACLNDLSGVSALGILITAGGMKGSFIDGILDYIRMLTHLDLLAFELLRGRIMRNEGSIVKLLECMGEWESDIVLASYIDSWNSSCAAELDSSNSELDISGETHPLIKHCVKNSIHTDGGVLITGSNASGKSTFLKTTALCVLFAQCTGYAPAQAYSAPYYRLLSSMSLRDSIAEGDSYYMTEIKSLKRITDEGNAADVPVICFIDEVLRGTNTIERIAASSQLLKSLYDSGIVVFAATHDLELASLLECIYTNYHFGEDMQSDDIVFTYILKEGPALTRNAISLLVRTGFDNNIVDAAREMAEHYEKTGEWRLL